MAYADDPLPAAVIFPCDILQGPARRALIMVLDSRARLFLVWFWQRTMAEVPGRLIFT